MSPYLLHKPICVWPAIIPVIPKPTFLSSHVPYLSVIFSLLKVYAFFRNPIFLRSITFNAILSSAMSFSAIIFSTRSTSKRNKWMLCHIHSEVWMAGAREVMFYTHNKHNTCLISPDLSSLYFVLPFHLFFSSWLHWLSHLYQYNIL